MKLMWPCLVNVLLKFCPDEDFFSIRRPVSATFPAGRERPAAGSWESLSCFKEGVSLREIAVSLLQLFLSSLQLLRPSVGCRPSPFQTWVSAGYVEEEERASTGVCRPLNGFPAFVFNTSRRPVESVWDSEFHPPWGTWFPVTWMKPRGRLSQVRNVIVFLEVCLVTAVFGCFGTCAFLRSGRWLSERVYVIQKKWEWEFLQTRGVFYGLLSSPVLPPVIYRCSKCEAPRWCGWKQGGGQHFKTLGLKSDQCSPRSCRSFWGDWKTVKTNVI